MVGPGEKRQDQVKPWETLPIMWPRRRAPSSLTCPLGVDFRTAEAIVCVGGPRPDDQREIVIQRVVHIALTDDEAIDRALLGEGIVERRAIIALAPPDVRTGQVDHAHLVDPKYHNSTAEAYADELIPAVPPNDRIVARLVVDGDHATNMPTLGSSVDRVRERAEQYGLTVVGVDAPGMAWLRVARDGIAVLTHAPMIAAPTPAGLFVQAIAADSPNIAGSVVQIVQTARGRNGLQQPRLATMSEQGSPIFNAPSETAFVPLEIDGHIMPDWAFAYALFQWSHAG